MNARLRVGQYVLSCLLLLIGFPQLASGQMFSYEADRPRQGQALSLGYILMDFAYDGEGDPQPRLDFDAPVYALRYARSGFDLSVAFGRQDASEPEGQSRLSLIDATLMIYGGIPLTGRGNFRNRIYLPILVYSGYRTVGRDLRGELTNELFNFTALGIGTGLGFSSQLGDLINLEARATPVLALALRSFEGSAGTSRLFDASVDLHILELVNQFGLSIGYGFRVQSWDINASDLAFDLDDNTFDYRATEQVIRIGVNW